MIIVPKMVSINRKYNNIEIKIGDDEVVYSTDINSFEEKSGVTIHNINFPITGYYIRLGEVSTTFSCGNRIDNLSALIKRENFDNNLIIFDFDGVEEVGESFLSSYTKFLLETSNKVITINMNISISNKFSSFISMNILEE